MSCQNCFYHDIDYEYDPKIESNKRIDTCELNRKEFRDNGDGCRCFDGIWNKFDKYAGNNGGITHV